MEGYLSPKSGEDQKQKNRSLPQFGWNRWDLFVLTGTFSSDHPALKSQWWDAKSRWGTPPPYNLSTEYVVVN